MPVLLLRLEGPLQSWGLGSRFSFRDTALEPTKSGVLGLLCAAWGVPREDDETLARLAQLRMGVRVEREGQVVTDFHSAGGGRIGPRNHGVARANGNKITTVISTREYLAGAAFVVGLEDSDLSLLARLDAALQRPVWPLCLGRRSFVPGMPPRLGVAAESLETALAACCCSGREGASPPTERRRAVLETGDPQDEPRADVPVSFHSERRCFRLRWVRTSWLTVAPH